MNVEVLSTWLQRSLVIKFHAGAVKCGLCELKAESLDNFKAHFYPLSFLNVREHRLVRRRKNRTRKIITKAPN